MAETKQVLARGGFNLTKFVTNDVSVLEKIDICDRATNVKDIVPGMQCKALGVRWRVSQDTFHYVVKERDDSEQITRRVILSHVIHVLPFGSNFSDCVDGQTFILGGHPPWSGLGWQCARWSRGEMDIVVIIFVWVGETEFSAV